jgi:heme oxygenase
MNDYSFSDELREKTKIVHDESDRLINLKVAAVLTDSRLWATAVAEFYYIFKAIEDSLYVLNEHPQVGVLSPIISEVRRVPAFEKDLQFFFGGDWKTHLKPSEFVVKYCARINEVTDQNPVILIA